MGSPRTAPDADLVEVRVDPLPELVRGQLAGLAKALADPQRVEIIHLLAVAGRPVCVLDVEFHLGLAQSTVSYHLKALLDAGLCEREPRGRWTYYTLRADVLAGFRHQLERLVHFPDRPIESPFLGREE